VRPFVTTPSPSKKQLALNLVASTSTTEPDLSLGPQVSDVTNWHGKFSVLLAVEASSYSLATTRVGFSETTTIAISPRFKNLLAIIRFAFLPQRNLNKSVEVAGIFLPSELEFVSRNISQRSFSGDHWEWTICPFVVSPTSKYFKYVSVNCN